MDLHETLKARWFWYSILCVLCWGGWALLSKLASCKFFRKPCSSSSLWGRCLSALGC